MTADQFMRLPSHRTKGFELIDGRRREKSGGALASSINVRLLCEIGNWSHAVKLGHVFESDCPYAMHPDDPRQIRKPSITYVRGERLPGGRIPAGCFSLPPDFAAHVVSAAMPADLLAARATEYLRLGVPLVWVLFPDYREVDVYRTDVPTERFASWQELSGDSVMPGLRVRIADLFPSARP